MVTIKPITLSCSIVVCRSNLLSERVSGEMTKTLTVLDIGDKYAVKDRVYLYCICGCKDTISF